MRDQSIIFLVMITVIFALLLQKLCADHHGLQRVDQVEVGLVVNMESWEGKIAKSSIEMAISDFYREHNHYKTRLVLHTRDSKGQPMRALSSALDLLDGVKVEAIIDPESQLETKLWEEIMHGKNASIPVVSFFRTTTQPSTMNPFFVHITQDETSQVKDIVAMIEAFKRRDIVLLYDNSNYQSGFITHLVGRLRMMKNINIAYEKAFLLNSTSDEDIVEELKKMKDLETKLFVVHLSPLFLSPLFLNAAKFGMMSRGSPWLMTTKSTNGLHFLNSSAIESMQGVIGFKNYKPDSWKINHFTSRMRMEVLFTEDPDDKVVDQLILSSGLWVYEGIGCLAKAIEREKAEVPFEKKVENFPKFGPILVKEFLKTELSGLSGGVRFRRVGKLMSNAFEIVNKMGNGDQIKRGGFRSFRDGTKTERRKIGRRRRGTSSNIDHLEAIKWSEGSHTMTEGSFMKRSRRINLKIGVPVDGFKELVNVEYENNKPKVSGFCVDVFTAAVALLRPDYDIHYKFEPFTDSNRSNTSGTYDDLVRQVYEKKYDAVVGDVTITADRLDLVDFTIPFTDIGVAIAASDDTKNTWLFLKPLSKKLWIAIVCFFIITGFVVWVIEHPINHEFQGSPSQQIGTTIWFAFSTLVYAHREKLVTNLSKFVVVVWLFFMFILNSSYTATLASMMTVKQLQLDPRYSHIGLPKANTTLQGLISHLNCQDFTLKPYLSSPDDYATALSVGSKNGGVSAIIDEIPYIKIFLGRYSDRNFYQAGTMSTTNGFAFGFRKGSPLVAAMSWAIAKLREDESLKMLEEKWLSKPGFVGGGDSLPMDYSINNNPNALTVDNFRGLFVMSGATSALAILIFLSVHLRKKCHVFRQFLVLFWRRIIEFKRF